MLTIWGDGRSRREFLQVGAMGVGGLSLADVLRLKAQAGEPTRAPHKAVIMIYLCGAPPHQDMFDLKLDAPAAFRGEFKLRHWPTRRAVRFTVRRWSKPISGTACRWPPETSSDSAVRSDTAETVWLQNELAG